jgi:hypothetical protein
MRIESKRNRIDRDSEKKIEWREDEAGRVQRRCKIIRNERLE